jgi:hypothetical protein
MQVPAKMTLILTFSLREKELLIPISGTGSVARAIDLPLPLGEGRVRAAERALLLTK